MTTPVIAETPAPTSATPVYPAATQTLVQAYSVQQAAVVAQALAEVVELWPLLDLANLDATAGPWTRRMAQVLDKYRGTAFGNATAFYNRLRDARIGDTLGTQPTRDVAVDLDRLADFIATNGPANVKHKTKALAAERDGFGEDRQRYLERVGRFALVDVIGASTQGVVDGAREATDSMMASDQTAIGYQRVIRSANPCAFCVMLASRGPVYLPKNNAGAIVQNEASVRYGKSYHRNCQCELLPVFDEDEPWLEDALEYRFAWDRVTEGHSTDDARKVWRRYWEGRNPNGRGTGQQADQAESVREGEAVAA